MLKIDEFVQELIANTVEHLVEIYEISDVFMSVDNGAELARIGDRLTKVLTEFLEDNGKC